MRLTTEIHLSRHGDESYVANEISPKGWQILAARVRSTATGRRPVSLRQSETRYLAWVLLAAGTPASPQVQSGRLPCSAFQLLPEGNATVQNRFALTSLSSQRGRIPELASGPHLLEKASAAGVMAAGHAALALHAIGPPGDWVSQQSCGYEKENERILKKDLRDFYHGLSFRSIVHWRTARALAREMPRGPSPSAPPPQ